MQELVARRNAFVVASRRADPEAGLRNLINWANRYKVAPFVWLRLDNGRIVATVDRASHYRNA